MQFFFFFFFFNSADGDKRGLVNGSSMLRRCPRLSLGPTRRLHHSVPPHCLLWTTLNDGTQCWTWISSIHWQPPLHQHPVSNHNYRQMVSLVVAPYHCWSVAAWQTPRPHRCTHHPLAAIDTAIELSINYYHYSYGTLFRHDCTSFIASSPPHNHWKFHIQLTNNVLQL